MPPIPEQISLAALEATLVIFVGAGVSRQMGSPSWNDLADKCLNLLATKGLITFGEVDQLSNLHARQRLSIARRIAESDPESLDFPRLVQPEPPKGSSVYESLKSLDCVYVTTNYDQFLDRDSVRLSSLSGGAEVSSSPETIDKLTCRPSQFTRALLDNPRAVIHLHGSVDDPGSMIVTTVDYLSHYSDPHVKNFLEELFTRYTVLFVGYGMEELEILEHICRKSGSPSEPQASRFMLTGYFSHQTKTFSHLQRYFRDSFGLQVIPFSRDLRNHDQIEEILKNWCGKLKMGSRPLSASLEFALEAANE